MTKYAPPGACDLTAIKSDGTTTTLVDGDGVVLPSTGVWYWILGTWDAPLPGETPLINVQLEWAAAVAGTFTLETCNFPRFKGGHRAQGPTDVDDIDANATRANWITQNPTTLYIPTPIGTGNSVSGGTITAGGTNFGGTMVDIGNLGCHRIRLRGNITAVGRIRVNVNGKAGG